MPANHDPDDYWGQAVTLFTGFPMPSRQKLFENLKSVEGIPLFRLDIQSENSMRAVTPADYSAISGWGKSSGQDYDLVFYHTGKGNGAHDASNTGVRMLKARIIMIGVQTDSNGRGRLLSAGETVSGGPFRGSYTGTEWNNGPVAQYVSGSKIALDALLSGSLTTRGVSWSGANVVDAEAVSLASFETTAAAFDRAKQFLVDQAAVLKTWEDGFGSDGAAWRGQAAGIFHQLIHQLRQNYDNYVDQLGGTEFTSTQTGLSGYAPRSHYSESVLKAQRDLAAAGESLRTAWTSWASTGRHDPHRGLLEILDEISAWVITNNAAYILAKTNADGGTEYSTDTGYVELHPVYGDLDKIENWKKVGDAAVARWNHYVDVTLITAASLALSTLNNNWITDAGEFEDLLETRNSNSLTDNHERNLNENNENQLNETLNNLNDNLGENIENLNQNLSDGLGDFGNSITDNLNSLGNGLGEGLGDLGNGLGNSLTTALNGPGGLGGLGGLGSGLGNLSNLGSGLGNTPSALNGLGNLGSLGDLNGGPLTNPGGGTTSLNPDGTLTTRFPDGSMSVFDPKTGNMTVTGKDGKKTTTSLDPGETFTNPDGSTTRLNADGTLTTTFPDGTLRTVDPDTGRVTTTRPDGTSTVQQLNPGLSVPDLNLPRPDFDVDRELNQLDDLRGLFERNGPNTVSGLGDAPGTTSSLNGLTGGLSSGLAGSAYEEYDSTPYEGGALRSGPDPATTLSAAPTARTDGNLLNPLAASGLLGASGAQGADGTGPMGPMGSPMTPMGGAPGAAGGQGGTNERTRNVLAEPGGSPDSRRRGGARNGSSASDDEDLADGSRRRPRTTGSAVPFAPATTRRPATESHDGTPDRERASWLAEDEDEDVWGTDEGAAPTVIG
ncbi:AAWKG family protein [Streptomyces sp. NPDC058579]|uniref:AAWKG family protein n=1 Tax=Streptomyces sp. NPDC058579 TaxID=3346548 RepID=UPI00364C401A